MPQTDRDGAVYQESCASCTYRRIEWATRADHWDIEPQISRPPCTCSFPPAFYNHQHLHNQYTTSESITIWLNTHQQIMRKAETFWSYISKCAESSPNAFDDPVVFVLDRSDGQYVPEWCSVFSIVQQSATERLPRLQTVSDLFDFLGVRVRALQEPTILANDLFGTVSSHGEEPPTSKHDRVVKPHCVSYHKCLLEGG